MNNIRICFTGPFEIGFKQEALPERLESDQLVLRTIFSLISPGTELALYTHTHVGFNDPKNLWAKYPFYPGYTAVGQVEKVGPAVEQYQPGDIVFYFGRHQLYTVISSTEKNIWAVPKEVPLEWVPFTRMAQIAKTALLVSSPRPGRRVAVLGLGLIGNFAAQLFQLLETEVFGLDLIKKRRAIAGECGLKRIFEAGQDQGISAIREATEGLGSDIVVEATGSPGLVTPALQMARPLGEVILLGSPRGQAEIDIYGLIHRTGISLKGAHEVLFSRLADRYTAMAQILEQIGQKQVVVQPLISQLVSPHQVQDSYQALLNEKDKALGILIDWAKV